MSSELERMTYKMEPAGHEEPSEKRKYEKRANVVAQAYEEWMKTDEWLPKYKKAKEILSRLQPYPSIEEAHAFLLSIQDRNDNPLREDNPVHKSLFLFAFHNCSPEKEIICDLKFEHGLVSLACDPEVKAVEKFAEDKTFLNYTPVDRCGFGAKGTIINYAGPPPLRDKSTLMHYSPWNLGNASSGTVINYGAVGSLGNNASGNIINYARAEASHNVTGGGIFVNLGKIKDFSTKNKEGAFINFGQISQNHFGEVGENLIGTNKSLVINCGEAGDGFGDQARGIVIDVNKPEGYGWLKRAKLLLRPEDCAQIPELTNYLNNLKEKFEQGRTDYKKALAALNELGPNPSTKVRQDIEEILRRAGKNV